MKVVIIFAIIFAEFIAPFVIFHFAGHVSINSKSKTKLKYMAYHACAREVM